jgi:hypothetical protein
LIEGRSVEVPQRLLLLLLLLLRLLLLLLLPLQPPPQTIHNIHTQHLTKYYSYSMWEDDAGGSTTSSCLVPMTPRPGMAKGRTAAAALMACRLLKVTEANLWWMLQLFSVGR